MSFHICPPAVTRALSTPAYRTAGLATEDLYFERATFVRKATAPNSDLKTHLSQVTQLIDFCETVNDPDFRVPISQFAYRTLCCEPFIFHVDGMPLLLRLYDALCRSPDAATRLLNPLRPRLLERFDAQFLEVFQRVFCGVSSDQVVSAWDQYLKFLHHQITHCVGMRANAHLRLVLLCVKRLYDAMSADAKFVAKYQNHPLIGSQIERTIQHLLSALRECQVPLLVKATLRSVVESPLTDDHLRQMVVDATEAEHRDAAEPAKQLLGTLTAHDRAYTLFANQLPKKVSTQKGLDSFMLSALRKERFVPNTVTPYNMKESRLTEKDPLTISVTEADLQDIMGSGSAHAKKQLDYGQHSHLLKQLNQKRMAHQLSSVAPDPAKYNWLLKKPMSLPRKPLQLDSAERKRLDEIRAQPPQSRRSMNARMRRHSQLLGENAKLLKQLETLTTRSTEHVSAGAMAEFATLMKQNKPCFAVMGQDLRQKLASVIVKMLFKYVEEAAPWLEDAVLTETKFTPQQVQTIGQAMNYCNQLRHPRTQEMNHVFIVLCKQVASTAGEESQ